MKLLKYLILFLFFFVIAAGLGGLMLPDTRHVEREISIDASAAEIFPYLNNWRKFNEWSPWAKIDPGTQYIFEGPAAGVGAQMDWTSENKTVGNGHQEIIESEPNTSLKSLMKLGKNDLSMASFKLTETAGSTTVVWDFDINLSNTISRYFGLTMEDWVGHTYEQGLSELKVVVEAR